MLDLLFGPRRRAAVGDSILSLDSVDGWPTGWRRTAAGVQVSEELALTYSAVWCASRILSETTAMLPLLTYRKVEHEDREQATDFDLYDVLKCAPNPTMGSMAFREGRTLAQVNWGNGFAEIERDRKGRVAALWPVHPSRVQPVRPYDDMPGYTYWVRNDNGTRVALRAEEMLHIPGVLSEDGIWGKGVVAYAREAVGFGLSTERHGARQFGEGNMPKVVLFVPGMRDREARENYRQEWKEIHGSPDAASVGMLPETAKLQKLSFSNEDAQFLGTRAFNVTEIARWYKIPPHMLADLEHATFSNIEHLSLEFVIFSLLPWLRRWEEQITLKLLTPIERQEYYVEHQLAGLLRGDLPSRMAAYQIALQNGIMTINECRRLENLNSIGPAGDANYVQLNMTTAQALALGTGQAMPGASVAGGFAADETAVDPEEAAEGESGAALLDVPDYRQQLPYDCGAACTQSVAEFYGVGRGQSAPDYVGDLGTNMAEGTTPQAIIDWFNKAGLVVTSGPGMTVEDLRAFFEVGQPVICPIQMYGTPTQEQRDQSGHYVVVLGVGLGQVFLQDPVAGRILMDAAEFDSRWHDMEAGGTKTDHFGIAVAESVVVRQPAEPEASSPSPAPSGPGKPVARQQALAFVLAERACGGPGSGVYGPCPGSGEEESVDPAREKDHEEAEARHDAEDATVEAGRDQEDAQREKERGQADKDVNRQRRREDRKQDRQDDKEDRQYERQKDKERAPERDALSDRHDKEWEAVKQADPATREAAKERIQKEHDEQQARYKAEDDAHHEATAKERNEAAKARGERREQEDAGRERQRAREDDQISAQRAKEDDVRNERQQAEHDAIDARHDAKSKDHGDKPHAARSAAATTRAVVMAERACGGPGSGVPGPCPEGDKQDSPKSSESNNEHVAALMGRHEKEAETRSDSAMNSLMKDWKGEQPNRDEVAAKLKETMKDSDLTVNFNPHSDAAAAIVNSGELRSAFTGGGRGKDYLATRLNQEASVFGAGKDFPNSDRPVYAAVNLEKNLFGAAGDYGRASFVLNKDAAAIKDNVTLTPGDSFGHRNDSLVGTLKNPLPALAGSQKALAESGYAGHGTDAHKGYVEAQIWGGKVPLNKDTVKEVRLPASMAGGKHAPALKDFADKQGIPFRTFDDKTGKTVDFHEARQTALDSASKSSGGFKGWFKKLTG